MFIEDKGTPWVKSANTIMYGVLSAQGFIALIATFMMEGMWVQNIVAYCLFTAPAFLLLISRPYDVSTRIVVGLAIQLNTALHIHITAGLTEMHFEIFAMLAILAIYQDWRVIASSVALIAIHHFLFFFLQSEGMPVYAFEEGRLVYGILAMHALFAVAEGLILIFSCRKALRASERGLYLSSEIEKITAKEDILDFTQLTKNPIGEDFYRMCLNIKDAIDGVNATLKESLDHTDRVESVSAKNSTLISNNNKRISTIASAVEETSVTNNELHQETEQVRKFSVSARQDIEGASTVVEESANIASALLEQLSSASDVIVELSGMCKNIDDQMGLIKGVADQTNLLALNAAIESARAGEHGRGFAVVADEVRQLSNRTSENAESISQVTGALLKQAKNAVEMMSSCESTVEDNREKSNHVKAVMEGAIEHIVKLDESINHVANATLEQKDASNDISKSTQELHSASSEQEAYAVETKERVSTLSQSVVMLQNKLASFSI
jgi:methyl-accepting chemotaxis protein